ncbi:AfsR/SARP family transcriptional regulator [Kitasatospora sp. NPDC096147]|uniref:AfsR/SARP family transcriptional regulator n=1 Tax=Kitasatospora sp. NPDC096147 TaxID=3364093 RepID=UPI00380DA55A
MSEEPVPTHDFRILGPLSVRAGGRELPVSSPKQRALLACLLLRAGQVVSPEELIRRLWDEQPPRDARAALHVHTTRLRALLRRPPGLDDRPVIETHPGGYRLVADPDSLDLTRYRAAARAARAARHGGHADDELAALDRALAEWRGDPLGTVPSASLQTEVVPQLIEEHLTLAERRFALLLEQGAGPDLVPPLRVLVAAHPVRERLREYLMLALRRAGQIAGALEEYRDYYRMLDRELGLLPGPELQELHRGLLTESALTEAPLPGAGPAGPSWPGVPQAGAPRGAGPWAEGSRPGAARAEDPRAGAARARTVRVGDAGDGSVRPRGPRTGERRPADPGTGEHRSGDRRVGERRDADRLDADRRDADRGDGGRWDADRRDRDRRDGLARDAAAGPGGDRPFERPRTRPVPVLRAAEPCAPWQVQRQLPPEATHFVGREELVEQVTAALTPRQRSVVPLVSLVGPPGIGKTALALRVAHRLGAAYPDGQWYVRLRDARGQARSVPDVIAELLRSSGADVSALPTDRHQLTGVLRSRLADRRVLIVIDDVDDSAQVPELLPGSPSCAVIALHREYRPDLLAMHGARGFTLDLLSHRESEELLVAVLGRAPETLSGTAVAELAGLCGRLPLALRIAAGHLAGRPWRSVESFAEALREGEPLDLLALGDSPSTAVRAAFGVAYEALPALSRRFFRLLGLVSDLSYTADTAASLADCEPQVADQLLDKLAAAQLIEVTGPGSYRFHSLIARYAAERGAQEDSRAERRQALTRLCRWYLQRVDRAVQSCYPGFLRVFQPEAQPDPAPVGARAAQDWLRKEQCNLVSLVVRTADEGLEEVCVQLADMMRGYFALGRQHTEWLTTAQAGLRAALRLGDPGVVAVMRLSAGGALQGMHRLPESARELRTAHRAFVRLGMRDFEAVTINAIAMNQLQQPTKQIDSAVTLLERGLGISRLLGLTHVEARGLMYLGMARHSQGRLRAAEEHFGQAVAILDEHGTRRSLPEVLARLGSVRADLGEWGKALADLGLALTLSEEFGATYTMALASYGLAQVHACEGSPELAFRHAEQAVLIARDHGYGAVEANARTILGGLHLSRHRPDEARAEFGRVLAIAERIGHPQAEVHSLIGLGRLELTDGRNAEAHALGLRAATVAERSGLQLLRQRAEELCRLAGRTRGPDGAVSAYRGLFPECA